MFLKFEPKDDHERWRNEELQGGDGIAARRELEAGDGGGIGVDANNTWTLADLPPRRKAVGCKWVYKIKYGVAGKIERFKARLVAQGFRQQYGSHYGEVFAPVIQQTTFRTLMAVAAKKNVVVKQYDVKTAFLNGGGGGGGI
ncbi:uncharacterized protein LOC134221542 [Armigeres subalbatus]|uniref:uncharacterized protein LOC134221542 n=1 Tax=Armigeres subalbatus TaxID=124917 RepID=UPI002ED020F6